MPPPAQPPEPFGDPEDGPAEPEGAIPAEHAQPDDGGSSTIVSRVLTITNRRGLHARAAAKLVTLADRFSASVDVVCNGDQVSARSIMGLMMLGAGQGARIELRADGWDAREAVDALAALVDAGFHEQD